MTSVAEAPMPRRNRGCLRDAAIVGSVILALVLVVGAAASFVFFLAGNTLKQEDMAGLSESKVYADLEALNISTPNLSGYAYVPTGGLIGPQFDNIEVGSIRYGSAKDGYVGASTRMVTADAGWRLTIHTLGETSATPLRPLNVYDLEDDVPSLLRMYDPTLGETYADAHVQLDANLWNTGGTVKATLSKTVDEAPMECVMDLVVSWSNSHGWIVEVADVTAQSGGSVASSPEQDALSPEPVEGDSKAQVLYCHEGDLVSLVGTLTQKDGVFILQTRPTAVHMSGRTWNVERFVVTGSSAQLTENLEKVVTVRGYMTAAYVFDDAPLSVAMISVS